MQESWWTKEEHLTSPCPREAAWTAPAADSAAPEPPSAPGWFGPAPVPTRHSCASASRSPPWSHAGHSEAPGTPPPTGDKNRPVPSFT